MSTIESQSGAAGLYRRNTLGPIDIPDNPGTLATPGLETAPPNITESRGLDGLLQTFSSLNGASAALLSVQHAEQAAADRRDELARRNKNEVEQADRGHANIEGAQDLPAIVSAIEQGNLKPNDGESVRDFTNRVVLQGTEGMPEAYTNQRLKLMSDNVAGALQRRIDANRKIAQTDNATLAVHSIDGATNGDQFDSAVTAFRKFMPDTPEEVAKAEIGKRWLDNAVATAAVDPKKATEILSAARANLGDQMQTEQLIAQNRYDAAVAAQQNKTLSSLQDDVGKMLDHGAPYPTVMSFIDEQASKLGIDVHALRRQVDTEQHVMHDRRLSNDALAKRNADEATRTAEQDLANNVAGSILKGDFAGADKQARDAKNVPAHFVLGLVDQVDSHFNRQVHESAQALKEQQKLAFTNAAVSQASSLIDAGRGNMIEDARVTFADGSEHKITRTELRDTAMGQKFAQIMQANKDDPQQAQAQVIKVASDNAYFPGGWKNLIEGAAGKITTAAIATSKDGKLSPDALQGYQFYKTLSAQAPGLLESMSLPSRTKELFTAAMELEKVPMVGADPMTALSSAANIVDDPHSQLDTVKLSAIANALDVTSQSDLEVARDAAPLARILTRLGKTPDAAVQQAVDQVSKNRITINGWSARIGNVPPAMRYQFADAAESKIDEYAKTIADTGVDKHELAFRYNDRTDLWEIVKRDTGLSVSTSDPNKTMFTTADMMKEATRITEADAIQRFNDRYKAGIDARSRRFPSTFLDRLDAEYR